MIRMTVKVYKHSATTFYINDDIILLEVITIQYYLNEGTILKKRYKLFALGRGGFGMTYLCSDFHTGNSVAVKEFFPRGAERKVISLNPYSDLKEAYFEGFLFQKNSQSCLKSTMIGS